MLRALALAALLIGCGGDDAATDPNLADDARAALGRDGWSDVAVEPVQGEPEGTFDFTGTYEGQRCGGTLVVRGEPGRRTTAISSSCP